MSQKSKTKKKTPKLPTGKGIDEVRKTLAELEPAKKTTEKKIKGLTRKKVDLFDDQGNVKLKGEQPFVRPATHLDRTEQLFAQEAERVESRKLSKAKTEIPAKPGFKKIFQQLTIVNLSEIFIRSLLSLVRKAKVQGRPSAPNEPDDPFIKPKRKPSGLASFIIFSLLFIIPFNLLIYYQKITSIKSNIAIQSQRAIQALKNGQGSVVTLNLQQAILSFNQAEGNFQDVLDEFNQLDFLTKSLINIHPQKKKATEVSLSLIEAGKSLATVGQILASSSQALITETAPLTESWQDLAVRKLAAINSALELALPKVAQARSKLATVDILELPAEYQEKFAAARVSLPVIESGLINISEITKAILQALGYPQWQRYLLIFQNNNELRATGGFMGSFALVDVDHGKIKNLEIPAGGSYDLQGSLTAMVASPEPLHLINPIWEFQDSNWWPDFPTTAQKIAWFYEKANGPSVDGVMALTTQVMTELLKVVGPIEMPKYNRTITAENFTAETQKIVELEYSEIVGDRISDNQSPRPKQFIADLAPEILKRLFNLEPDQMSKVWSVLASCLQQKHLQIYSNHPEIQHLLSQLNWSGEFKAPAGSDYLAVINTNLAGGKTDSVISQTINHQVEITAEGKIIDTVTITKVHHGEVENVFTGVQNNSYLRVYVPLGSTLLAASGFDKLDASLFEKSPTAYSIDQDLLAIESQHQIDSASGTEIYNEFSSSAGKNTGKTVFANWLLLKPGEQKTVTLKYELPFTISELSEVGLPKVGSPTSESQKLYKLFVQKQAGTNGDRFSNKIINNSGLKIVATNPQDNFQMALEGDKNSLQFTDKLVTDKVYEVKFE